MIMEALGGDQDWQVRFFAQHASIIYYFVLIALWITSPSLAYNFSELIEAHAVDTYREFAESNRDLLLQMEAPRIAKEYYENVDMYVFDEFQTSRVKGSRRPKIETLYDVFQNIWEDEAAHVATMAACQDPDVVIRSPNTEAAILASTLSIAMIAALSTNILPSLTNDIESIVRDFISASTSTASSTIDAATNLATDSAIDAVTQSQVESDSSSTIESLTELKKSLPNVSSEVGKLQDLKSILQTIADMISKLRF
jgi:hypothetical protein